LRNAGGWGVGLFWASAPGFDVISQPAAKETLNGRTAPEPAAIRAQLQRLLAHPLFTHSKRYPVLLAYAVEQTLLGHAANLKERTIGIEAFRRQPDYDANADPVVRTTAAEVRKRLIQYYYDPSHTGELIIEFSAGSYVPAFRPPNLQKAEEDAGNEPELLRQEISAAETDSLRTVTPVLAFRAVPSKAESAPAPARPKASRWIAVAACLLLAVGLGFGIGRYRPATSPSNIDVFWEPVTSNSGLTTYCLGEPDRHTVPQTATHADRTAITSPDEQLQTRLYFSGRMNMSDVVTLTHTTAPLASHHGSFRVLAAYETSFAQLREGPIVLIGAFDNPWTLRLTEGLPYGFETKDGLWRVTDRRSKQPSPWAVQMNQPVQNLKVDYAIVARIHDSTTGQPVILVAGISDQGTEAASEVVYNPVYLDSLIAKAPKNWSERNMEAVLETHVIDGHPGAPDILAVETW